MSGLLKKYKQTQNKNEDMKARQLLDLRCPFCSSSHLELTQVVYWPNSQEIRSGLLRCVCDVFPIVDGIVVLRRNQQVIVQELMRAYQADTQPNMLVVLNQLSEFRLVVRRVFVLLVQITSWFKRVQPNLHHAQALTWWKMGLRILAFFSTDRFSRAVFNYFRERDLRPTYSLISATTPLLHSARVVVEVGGGAGHFVRLMSQQQPECLFYSLEKNFWLVYWLTCNGLYRPNVCPIVMNFEGGLPFQNAVADVVMANDTIMYVNHQHRLATELKRVMKKNGWCIGMHVHQSGFENVAQGNGVQPDQFFNWLGLSNRIVWPDQRLFQHLWARQKIEFTTKHNGRANLSGAASFSFIASHQPKTGTLCLESSYPQKQLNYVEDQWQN